MRLIHNDELRAVHQKEVPISVALHEIDARDLDRIVAVDAFSAGFPTVELVDGARPDDHGFEVGLAKLPLPLVAEIGWTQDAEPLDLAAIEQLARDEQRLDGLADAHVVGDQEADWVQAQRHQERDKLVNPRPDGDAAERPERRRAITKGQASCLPQKMRACGISQVVGRWQRELGRPDAFFGQGPADEVGKPPVDGDHVVHCSCQRPEQMDFIRVTRQQHPIAVAAADNRSGGHRDAPSLSTDAVDRSEIELVGIAGSILRPRRRFAVIDGTARRRAWSRSGAVLGAGSRFRRSLAADHGLAAPCVFT